MDKIPISIIVPVYNVERYLQQCITSIQNQTYKNIEIILVDDGSLDNSGSICDFYKENDSRIKVIHQNNGGLTVARRNGVNLARGEYIGFVDGDDWIEPNMYEFMIDKAYEDKSDIVTIAGIREYKEYKTILKDEIPSGKYKINDDNKYILKHLFSKTFKEKEYLNGAVWSKLFKRDILLETLNQMNDNINGYMDDNVCVVGCVIKAEYITSTQEVLYHHRERDDAFTHSKNKKGLMQVNYAYLGLEEIVENSIYKDILYSQMREQVLSNAFDSMLNLFEEDLTVPQYFFRSNKIIVGAKVVIYGAGKVGQSYYNQLNAENKYGVCCMIDKNPEGKKNAVDLVKLRDYQYDNIIIAVLDENMAKRINNELVQNGIRAEKIIWERPMNFFEYYNIL